MIHTNTFYKPKNEYGELLAARKYVDIEISDNINALKEETNKKIDDLTANFEEKNADVTDSITELQNKQYLTFTPIFNQPIEEYIASLHSLDNFDPVAFKIKIGQTIYLRETGAGEAGEYEEYICINPYDYIPEAQNYGALVFNRLGAVEAIVASNRRHGSVRLLDSIYNVENWEDFRHEEKGTSPVSYAPSEGVAVAPYALKDFKDADNALKDKDIELEGAIAETNLKVEKIDNRTADNEAKIERIIDELGGIKEDNNAEITDSRIDKNEADISANKELIDELRKVVGLGPHDCNSSSTSCNCGHECKFDTEEDCCLICKVNNLDDAVNTNADSLVNLSDAFDEAVERLNFAEDNINTLNTTVGSLRDIHNPDTLRGKITFLQEKDIELDGKISDIDKRITANENNIGIKDSDIKTTDNIWGNIRQIESDIVDANTEISNINITVGNPDNNSDAQTLFGRIKKNRELIDAASNTVGQWDTINNGTIANAIKTVQKLSEDNKDNITANKASTDELSSKVENLEESLGTNPDPTGEVVTAWGEISRLKTNKAENSALSALQEDVGRKTDAGNLVSTLWAHSNKNASDIKEIQSIIGDDGDTTTSTIWGKIGSLSDEIEETIDKNIGELTTRTENIEKNVDKLESEVAIIYSYPRNIILGVVIPSAAGSKLELLYPEIFKAAFGEDAGTYPNHEVIINSIKLKDDNNDYYEQAMPEIQYKGTFDASGDNDLRYINIEFADKDAQKHEAIISLTVYDNSSTTSKFLIYK